jgi:mRNA interferase HigB
VDILNRDVIEQAKKEHSAWKGSLNSWEKIVAGAAWKHFADVRLTLKSADLVGVCVVFNIARNAARLIAIVSYEFQTVTVSEVLSHAEYAKERWKNACNC